MKQNVKDMRVSYRDARNKEEKSTSTDHLCEKKCVMLKYPEET